jgi:hypothetical protein
MWRRSVDPWDQDAVSATVALQTEMVQAQCGMVLWGHELVALRRALDALLHHDARASPRQWVGLDGTLVLILAVPDPHAVSLIAALQDSDAGVALRMELVATPAALLDVLAQIDAALDRYPLHTSYLRLLGDAT